MTATASRSHWRATLPRSFLLTAEQNIMTVEVPEDEQKRDLLYQGISGRG